MNKDIYKMELHDLIKDGAVEIVRVAGGWIYSYANSTNVVFVPFNSEFM